MDIVESFSVWSWSCAVVESGSMECLPGFREFLIVIYLLIPDFDSDQVTVKLLTTPLVLITTRDNVIADRL